MSTSDKAVSHLILFKKLWTASLKAVYVAIFSPTSMTSWQTSFVFSKETKVVIWQLEHVMVSSVKVDSSNFLLQTIQEKCW